MVASGDIDAAVARLDEAVRSVDLPGLEQPSDVAPVAEIADAVAPHVLPPDLRRFWELVDGDRIAVFTFPRLTGAGTTLELLRGLRELGETVPLVPPPILLPVDYASHCYGVVELQSDWNVGGTIFEWEFDAVQLVATGIVDRIDLIAELLAEGHFERGDAYVTLDHRAEQASRLRRLAASGPDPVYGDARAPGGTRVVARALAGGQRHRHRRP